MSSRDSCQHILGLLSFAATLFATALPGTGAPAHIPVLFPVMVEPAQSQSATEQDGQILLAQALRPTSAATIQKDITIHFQSSSGQEFGGGSPTWDFTVPSGSTFIGAISGKDPYYCASKSMRDAFFTHYDVAICLRDANRDEMFEQVIVVDEGLHRIRSPFEIKYLDGGQVQTVAVPYSKLAGDSIPAAEIRITYKYTGNFLTKLPKLKFGICWPWSLPLPTDGVTTDVNCGSTDWLINGRQHLALEYALTGDTRDRGIVTWGPLTVTFSLNADHSIKANSSALPTGLAVLFNRGEFYLRGDNRNETSILHLQMLKADGLKVGTEPPI
ncbi:MAG TPA: hypothetical protein VJL82_03850 [Rhizomicrobium sp.]|nr:hypothetical protein [Rhizomicrobium sp.]